MRKLRLDIEELEVESFSSESATHHVRGTVQGAEVPTPEHKIPFGTYDLGCTNGADCQTGPPGDFTPYCVPSLNIPNTCVAPC